ncbi:MAG: hypothetical protein ACRCYQ_11525 [Nocardioides sp.]
MARMRVSSLVFALTAMLSFGVMSGPAAVAAAEEPVEVYVGAYAMTIQELDQQNSSFYGDFYLWMRWDATDDPEFDPSATMEFVNNLERWGLTQNPVYEKPKELPNGQLTQQYHVQGKFFSALELTDYPLDRHRLSFEMEDNQTTVEGLVYLADTEQSALDSGLKIPGWSITGSEMIVTKHTYTTKFGEAEGAEDTYSRASFGIDIERPGNFFVWKLMLPLLIVILIALSILVVHPSQIEVRLAAPATALLALVFLQQAYTSTLPETGNLVLLDKIYVLSYALVVALMLVTIVTSHWARDGTPAATVKAIRLDRAAEVALFAAFVLGVAFLILTR